MACYLIGVDERMAAKKQSGYDLEEITPNHFVVHNDNAYSVLRGEGERRGQLFELTSWRREGLLARLAARGYRALTLDDRLARLPKLPEPMPFGEPLWRPLASTGERLSVFDPHLREWQPIEPETRSEGVGMTLRSGQVVRRRKGRSVPTYSVIQGERSGIGMRPVDETTALLAGYAQAAAFGSAPLAVQRDDEGYFIPNVLLPQSYREFLRRVAKESRDGWHAEERGMPYVQRALEQLGFELKF